ncbi:Protein of unknown function DUF247 [Macleaya cordata]|uniref:Uncharacterized protein n=1 Tax=Macleaya cordata TaxID=56857 RepID=A0A200PT38_MACCD|nr:Protein of unknown function DUF247 [Macleaya cordata]
MGDASQQNGETQHVSIEIAEPNKGLDESIKGKLESSIPSHFLVANALLELQRPKLEKCVESAIRKIEEEARKCYSEPINMNSNEFVEMMLLVDGLFIIELFRKSAGKEGQEDREVLKNHSNCKGKHLLDLLGVKFKKGSTKGSFLDIKFNDGVFGIPPVIIQDQTDSLSRNLIASEQCCDGHVTYMTSYAFFMDSLINSGDDVGLLRNQGIITNYLGDDEDVSVLFNSLICCEVTLTDFYFAELCDQVNIYYKTRWHKWRATLKRDYFNNPWAILSVIADVVLLALTLISTIFASLS